MATSKGFIQDFYGNRLLPITRGELVLDSKGNVALHSTEFLASFVNGKDVPGLITAAERAMLVGGSDGISLTDVYSKLSYINTGLKFNGKNLKFYDDNNVATPINIVPTEGIDLFNIEGTNNVTIGLSALAETQTTIASSILRSINVDTYGRVTSVSGSLLTVADLPADYLDDKTITNSTLQGCISENLTETSSEQAIANKKYVDSKFNTLSSLTTGALKFFGSVISESDAKSKIENAKTNSDYLYRYYKTTAKFTLSSDYVHSKSGDTYIDVGDTLIIYQQNSDIKYVHIPSGDDITSITILDNQNATILDSAVDNVTLAFSYPFTVSKNGNDHALIGIRQATAQQGGYLSKDDYNEFKSAAGTVKSVSYTSIIAENDPSVYQLGTLKVGDVETKVLGKYNLASLTLENGSENIGNISYNPILKFSNG